MLFHRINRTNPEKVYVIVKNSYATADASQGQVYSWDYVTDKDGISVTKPSGVLRSVPAGVAIAAIASGDYGLLQVWGHNTNVKCKAGSGLLSSKISAGSLVYIKTSGFEMYSRQLIASSASITIEDFAGIAGVSGSPTNTAAKFTSATTWVGTVFIKCL